MNQEQAVYRINRNRQTLALPFERILKRIETAATGEPGRILAEFAFALISSLEFNLDQIDELPDQDDRDLCAALFTYCLESRLTEDDRSDAAEAFASFAVVHTAGLSH
jgi:hypothetical protein